MPNLIIDGQALTVPEGSTVLQAIRSADIHLPTLCYWEGLPPYGACRLCLVEMICAATAGDCGLLVSGGRRDDDRDAG